jgi:hypothetical protein
MEINRMTGIIDSIGGVLHAGTYGFALLFHEDGGARWMVMIRGTNYRIREGDVLEIIDDEVLWIPAARNHDGQRFATMGNLHPILPSGGQKQ